MEPEASGASTAAGRGPRGAATTRVQGTRGPARITRPPSKRRGPRWDTWLRDVTACLVALAAVIPVGIGLYRLITEPHQPTVPGAGHSPSPPGAGTSGPPIVAAAPVPPAIAPGPDPAPAVSAVVLTVPPPDGPGLQPKPAVPADGPILTHPEARPAGTQPATPPFSTTLPATPDAIPAPDREGSCRWEAIWPHVGVFGTTRGDEKELWMEPAPHVFVGDCTSVEGIAPRTTDQAESYYHVDEQGTIPAGYIRAGAVRRVTTEAGPADG